MPRAEGQKRNIQALIAEGTVDGEYRYDRCNNGEQIVDERDDEGFAEKDLEHIRGAGADGAQDAGAAVVRHRKGKSDEIDLEVKEGFREHLLIGSGDTEQEPGKEECFWNP